MYEVFKQDPPVQFNAFEPSPDAVQFVEALNTGDCFDCPVTKRYELEKTLTFLKRHYKVKNLGRSGSTRFWIIDYKRTDKGITRAMGIINNSPVGVSRRDLMRRLGLSLINFNELIAILMKEHGVFSSVVKTLTKPGIYYFPSNGVVPARLLKK